MLNISVQNNVLPVLTSVNNPLVRNLVFRMSFSDSTPAASAIIYSIFALASIHLTDRPRAQMYKSKARNAVWESATQSSSTVDALRRIVAVNLLAMFEVGLYRRCSQVSLKLVDTCDH